MRLGRLAAAAALCVAGTAGAAAQSSTAQASARRAHVFSAARSVSATMGGTPAVRMQQARAQRAALTPTPGLHADTTFFDTPWQAVGPVQVASLSYGLVTGRVTAVAMDPADASRNTVYVGTTGGGVWKSTNAAGPAASVVFTPLTDSLIVYSPGVSGSVTASLSIGALTIQPGGTGVVLAGTGDPNDATDSYYGQGILRSADNGQTWSLVEGSDDGAAGRHSFGGEGFAGFAWSSTTPGLVVAAVSSSAESSIVNAGTAGASARGLYVSMDAGGTWQMATIEDGGTVVQGPSTDFSSFAGNAATSVAYDSLRGLFVAAVRSHGYYQSADGVTWTRMANQPGAGLTVANCPARAGLPGMASCPIQRGALTVQPVSGDLFALTVDASDNDQGLWKDACAASNGRCASGTVAWGQQISTSAMDTSGAIPSGDYNLVLSAVPAATAMSPTDTLLFAGAGDLYRCSLAGGCTLRNTTNATNGCAAPAMVAPAQHAMAWALNPADSASPLMFFGNDGGLWRSTDGVNQQGSVCSSTDASHFQNLNGGLGSLAEVVSLASHPFAPSVVLAGLGGNGSAASSTTAQASDTAPWPQLSAAESGAVAIGQADGSMWMVQGGGCVSLHTCASGTACTASDFGGPPQVGIAQTAGDLALADPPAILDPGLEGNLLTGTCRVWRGPASGGSAWTSANAISPVLAGATNPACTSTDALIRSLGAGGPVASTTAAQTSGASVLYAGLAGSTDGGGTWGGHLFVNSAAGTGTDWTDTWANPVSNGNGAGFNPSGFDISGIAVDPHDPSGSTVYATVMGFGTPHVYRSTDAGTSWTNINSNLPDAPANAVAVDPNSGSIVYVATDTGVYATVNVTSCGTLVSGVAANCWSLLGTGLPNAPVTALTVTAGIQAPGTSAPGILRAGTYGRGIWQIPLLSITSVPVPEISVSPAALSFAAQAPGTTSAPQTVTIVSSGSGLLAISSVGVTSGFGETDTCTNKTLAPGQQCTVQVVFTPTGTGAQAGTLTITSNSGGSAGSSTTMALNAAANGPVRITLTPTALGFGSVDIGSVGAVQNIAIANVGSSIGTVGAASVTGDFAIRANTCGPSLAPSTGCMVSIAFVPTASGTRNGMFTLQAQDGTYAASLTGNGLSPATDTLSRMGLSFAQTTAGSSSASQAVTLTNSGDTALTLVNAAVTAGDFTATSNCGATLAGHSSCSISVVFAPRSVGALTGTLTVRDVQRVQTVALSGLAVAPAGISAMPSSLRFGDAGVGVSPAPQTVTLSNNTGASVTIVSIPTTGEFGVLGGGTTCVAGNTLAAGASCTVAVVFMPQQAGPNSGTVAISTSAGIQTTMLSGTGVDFTLTVEGSSSASVSGGVGASYALLLTPAQASTDALTFACTGLPANSTCTVTPQYGDLSATGTVAVAVKTGVSTSAGVHPRGLTPVLPWLGGGMAAALLLPFSRWRYVRTGLLLFVCAVATAGVSGCGAGRAMVSSSPSGPGSGSSGGASTAPGTYAITVSASAAGLTRTVQLNLVVQ